ncbi:cyclase [Mesorhizobium sp. B3-2-1]|uniref:cyclase n=1 Tax=unclassified Mesorhizobium TaxID=325217 RepID=UPI00112DD1FF|nr:MULTISPECIES: cyclase [unclassified Mesorhizobium]MBZ9672447.1 cyclase [Mesorhizobium sp. ES1-3]MBZ9706383.1 cyclase [Mesorhizobium sp. ESP7-2]TPI33077.1 cyclase [Mesorhizobium sp. B3-2-1]
MTTLFVRHTVSDYEAWRKVYDGFAPVQKANGVKAEAVYQAADNPNDVTVTHDFASAAEAQAFIKNPKLKEAMASAGVVGAPTMWITNKA